MDEKGDNMNPVYKFYKPGQDDCPFDQKRDFTRYTFWYWEREIARMSKAAQEMIWVEFKKALMEGYLSGDLLNERFSEDERAVFFYINYQVGKFDPYAMEAVDWDLYFLYNRNGYLDFGPSKKCKRRKYTDKDAKRLQKYINSPEATESGYLKLLNELEMKTDVSFWDSTLIACNCDTIRNRKGK